jgi:hypothetical protein
MGRFYSDAALEHEKGETRDRLVHQGIHLLERFAQGDRIRMDDPRNNLQIKILHCLPGGSDFLAYVDAIGEVDGLRCIIDWKTTTARYSENPEGLFSLDPQLVPGLPEFQK